MTERRNVEVKVRVESLEPIRRALAELPDVRSGGILHQCDTYYRVDEGRLKLREFATGEAELIWYLRPDEPAARTSRYHRVAVTDATGMHALLAAAFGETAMVRKVRELHFWQQVRLHLDDVEGRGCFLELEAVLGDEVDEARGREQVAFLLGHFQIAQSDVIPGSYGDPASPAPW